MQQHGFIISAILHLKDNKHTIAENEFEKMPVLCSSKYFTNKVTAI